MEAESSSSSTTTTDLPNEGGEGEVEELLSNGRRYYLCSNYSLASQSFQEACQTLSDKHGEMSPVLVEPYYWYGKSLLELARQESCVLGGGVPVPPTHSDSSDEEEEEEEETTSDNQVEGSVPHEATPTENTTQQEATPTKTSVPLEDTNDQEATPTKEPVPVEATPTEGEEGEEKDVSTLQLAWEVLEVSKLICQNLQSTESQLLLAEINLLLGEVGLESDQYDQAIDDFTTCLQIREAILSPDDRKLAEIHFNLGLTYSLLKRPQDSVAEFGLAKQVLELRKEMLQSDVEKEKGEGEKAKLLKEIQEISELVPDIESKILEEIAVANDLKGKGESLEEEADEDDDEEDVSCSSSGFGVVSSGGVERIASKNEEPITSNGIVSSSTSGSSSSGHHLTPVNDISHLVKRKPKVSSGQQQDQEAIPAVTTNGDLSHNNEAVPLKKRRISLDSCTLPVAKMPSARMIEADSTTTPSEQ